VPTTLAAIVKTLSAFVNEGTPKSRNTPTSPTGFDAEPDYEKGIEGCIDHAAS
jgi:hypothetical protein